MRYFIHKTFDGKGVLRAPYRAPEGHGHMGILNQVLDAVLAKSIGHIGETLDRAGVDAIFDAIRADPRQDGVRHRLVKIGYGHAIGIEPSAEADGRHGPVKIVPHVPSRVQISCTGLPSMSFATALT